MADSQRTNLKNEEPVKGVNIKENSNGRRSSRSTGVGKPTLIVLLFIVIGIGGLYYRKSTLEKPNFFTRTNTASLKPKTVSSENDSLKKMEQFLSEQQKLIAKKDEIIAEKAHKINELENSLLNLKDQVFHIQTDLKTLEKRPYTGAEIRSNPEIIKHIAGAQKELRLLAHFERKLMRGKPFKEESEALRPYLSIAEKEKLSQFDAFSQTGLLTSLKMIQKLHHLKMSPEKSPATSQPLNSGDPWYKKIGEYLQTLIIIEPLNKRDDQIARLQFFEEVEAALKAEDYERALELLKSEADLKDNPFRIELIRNLQARISLEAFIEELITNFHSSSEKTLPFNINTTTGD